MKHTPGPWRAKKHTEGEPGYEVIIPYVEKEWIEGKVGKIVCEMGGNNDEDYANARLIAAAPEMFEAIKFAFDELEDMTTDEFSRGADKAVRDKLLKALAKVRGEEE